MADFIKTISCDLRVFGLEPPTRFGQNNGYPYTMVWGTQKWGSEGNSIILLINLVEQNAEPVVTSTVYVQFQKVLSGDITIQPVIDPTSEKLSQGNWYYVLGEDTEGEDRTLASWTAGSGSSVSYVCQAAQSTTWT